jgi:glycosyltransferase involved in cell wall biosynthesis
MRVLVDALSAREGGGITDLVNLAPALAHARSDLSLAVLLSSSYQKDLIHSMPERITPIPVNVPATPPLHRLAYLQHSLPIVAQKLGSEILLSMSEVSSWSLPCPMVVLVRNASVLASRSTMHSPMASINAALYGAVWRPLIRKTFRCADRLIFVSRNLQDRFGRVFAAAKTKGEVVYLGVGSEFHQQATDLEVSNLEAPYVLAVSTILPHKNHETLIRAFARLRKQEPSFRNLALYVAGSIRTTSVYKRLTRLCRTLGISNEVNFLGRVPHDKMASLYRGALAVVLPSRLESFGHPLVEAMACGTPVIASDLAVCREICGDAALFFPPDDVAELINLLALVVKDPEVRNAMRKRGQGRAQNFSWTGTARGVEAVLRNVVVASGQSANAAG